MQTNAGQALIGYMTSEQRLCLQLFCGWTGTELGTAELACPPLARLLAAAVQVGSCQLCGT